MPKIPTVLNEIEEQKIADEFNAQYQNLFFTFLDKIITRNTIEQELTKQRLTTIITHTEQQLCSFDIPYKTLICFHTYFLEQCNIEAHDCLPEYTKKTTQKIIENTSTTITKTGKKRKTQEPQPHSTKQTKIDHHFLCLGPPHTRFPT